MPALPTRKRVEAKYHVDKYLLPGSENARTARVLEELTEIDNRDIRRAIRELIADGEPVAYSTKGKAGGYFIATTQAEVDACLKEMQGRIIELAKRMRDFKRAARSIQEPGQLPMTGLK